MKTFLNALLFCLIMVPATLFAQTTVTGTVTDKANAMPLPGVNVIVKGTARGTSTDFDGNFSLEVSDGETIVISYLGYTTQEIVFNGQSTINVELSEDAAQLDEVVLIGYGSVKKEDATGSVDVVSSKDFNKGAIVSTDQLLNGKAAGVRITTDGGSPDAAPNIRIRGGSSLSANSNPLIVIDGVPIANNNPAGVSNPLTLVNPNDVESFSILKDASATAIYGSRASNGVIIITTKKGTYGDEVRFNFSSNISVSSAGEGLDMMNSEEYVRFIQEYHPNYIDYLGVPVGSVSTPENVSQVVNGRAIYDTDWRDHIYRTAISTNTNFSARANILGGIPFRASVGYTNSEGVVKTDDYERYTAAFKLTPQFLDDNLKIDINAKATYADKNAADSGGAIGNAIAFDPTKPVYDSSSVFGGYYMNMNGNLIDGRWNPVAQLLQRERPERVFRFLGNTQFDYKMPFLPELKAVVNLGLDASRAKIKERFSNNAIATYSVIDEGNDFVFNPGVNYIENQHITNATFDAYLQYNKSFDDKFINKYDVQAGYSYQNFKNDGNQERYQYNTVTGLRELVVNVNNPNNRYYNVLNLQSFFGRANIDLANKYLLTLSFRADGSSLFQEDDRWGYFPSAALAWKIKKETFLNNISFFNDLKLRLGWGQTGQQDITGVAGYYPSIPLFQAGDSNSQYLPNSSLYSALPFNPDLTWEKTTTYNIGLDFDILKNNLISGSFDVYYRETTDLLADVPVPPGQAFSSSFIDNVGETESKGFELNLNISPISTENFTFDISSNLSYNHTKVTDLEGLASIPTGGTVTGTGTFLQRHSVGQQAGSAYVFKQLYDADGQPIAGAFADRNGDNIINDDDRYYQPIAPNWTYGFGLNFTYKNWDLTTSFRGQFGGNVFNLNKLNYGTLESAIPNNNNSLTNVLNFYDGASTSSIYEALGNTIYSDYYLEDATFLRCDNIVLGYSFDNIIKDGVVRFYGSVTNPFIITDYSGQDPENFGGIDGSFYPRPTVVTLGFNFDF
ncbi:TonB-dependent receptor [Winogradskyella sp. SYSU M77433]|uniref:SusC/RagA family TonB-linked outer membrane protein n=1 Tax=Winogradskyella sp. SYSU M77433 TaxID=3042722 RepID=UPI002480D5AD|nr:TonB-dependent receptor [Winogradskyella sp. SYSU M77433]MDH7911930.1 TonB-dependent receptor [Winogradskyella sp. SYSU M77433]